MLYFIGMYDHRMEAFDAWKVAANIAQNGNFVQIDHSAEFMLQRRSAHCRKRQRSRTKAGQVEVRPKFT
jgi:hypothetical protein